MMLASARERRPAGVLEPFKPYLNAVRYDETTAFPPPGTAELPAAA
ncbi:hypothetical protein [Streptomyces sp. NPDC055134]